MQLGLISNDLVDAGVPTWTHTIGYKYPFPQVLAVMATESSQMTPLCNFPSSPLAENSRMEAPYIPLHSHFSLSFAPKINTNLE